MTLKMMRLLLAAALCAAALPAAAKPLAVCIDQASPSLAMDLRVATAAAAVEHVSLAVVRFNGDGDDDGYSLKNFRTMAATRCALVLGFPLDATRPEPPAGLLATQAYAHVGFVLAEPAGRHERDLGDFPAGSDVGVTYLTTPNLYFEAHPNVTANVFDTEAETLDSLLTHKVRAALLWRPTVVRYQLAHPGSMKLRLQDLTEPHARFDIVALYAASSASAARQFATDLDTLAGQGRLAGLVAPFAQPGAAVVAPQQHAASENYAAPHDTAAPRPQVVASMSDSMPPQLFTAGQAAAGGQKFIANCAICHGKDLKGIAGPALTGKNFASAKANFHVSDVFRIISVNMPATQPGSLAHDDYVEIMAFLLQQNGYPAGSTPLTYGGALKSDVPLLYHGD